MKSNDVRIFGYLIWAAFVLWILIYATKTQANDTYFNYDTNSYQIDVFEEDNPREHGDSITLFDNKDAKYINGTVIEDNGSQIKYIDSQTGELTTISK